MPEVGSSAWHPEGMSLLRCHQAPAAAGGIGMGSERIIPQPANCGLGDLQFPYPIDMLIIAWGLGDNIPPEHKEVKSVFDGGLQIRRNA